MRVSWQNVEIEPIGGTPLWLSETDARSKVVEDIRRIVTSSPENPGRVANPVVLRVSVETSLAANGWRSRSPVDVRLELEEHDEDADGSLVAGLHFTGADP